MRASIARWVALAGGAGLAPKAPGTAGSLVAVIAGAAMLRAMPRGTLAIAAVASVVGGTLALRSIDGIAADPGWVVIDEVAGQWITMLGLGRDPGALALAASFGVFRALDIAKPGPIGWADRKPGAFGVMADDVIAGAIGALLIAAVRRGLAR